MKRRLINRLLILALPREIADAARQLGDVATALEGGLALARLGIRPELVQDMAKAYYATKARGITHEDLMDLGSIKRRAFMDGFRTKGEEQ